MKILVIGSGGREHALVWKIAQSRLVDKIFCAPGNGGISEEAECLEIKADNIQGLLDFAKKEKIDLTVVGPEVPLSLGIVDQFMKYGLKIFGPQEKAARLEASKVFSKQLMARYGVPTADFKVFDNPAQAKSYIREKGAPCVVKADGLAAGKGVVVAKTNQEAFQAVESMMQEKIFGEAGNQLIVEDCLAGEEASILVLTDSRQIIPLASSQDHKRIFDNDQGPNTGGMGAYSPARIVSEEVFRQIIEQIVHPTIHGLVKEGIDYKGVLYAGVMLTKEGPKVLEFNVRFGDPETQAILPLLKSDIIEAMLAVVNAQLTKLNNQAGLNWASGSCVCVVCASGGYPGKYDKGKEISGLAQAAKMQDIAVFHAGTKVVSQANRKKVLTSGGRVLGVTGLGEDIKQAIEKTYQAVKKINFEGMHYRNDIGARAIRRVL